MKKKNKTKSLTPDYLYDTGNSFMLSNSCLWGLVIFLWKILCLYYFFPMTAEGWQETSGDRDAEWHAGLISGLLQFIVDNLWASEAHQLFPI